MKGPVPIALSQVMRALAGSPSAAHSCSGMMGVDPKHILLGEWNVQRLERKDDLVIAIGLHTLQLLPYAVRV